MQNKHQHIQLYVALLKQHFTHLLFMKSCISDLCRKPRHAKPAQYMLHLDVDTHLFVSFVLEPQSIFIWHMICVICYLICRCKSTHIPVIKQYVSWPIHFSVHKEIIYLNPSFSHLHYLNTIKMSTCCNELNAEASLDD